MVKKQSGIRILLNTLLGSLILVIGVWICHKTTLSAYTYTENIIESEAKRIASNDVTQMNLTVTNSSTLDDIAKALYEGGLITDANYFKFEAKLEKQTTDFIPGDYAISSNMSTTEILNVLTTNISNEDETIKFTIPEGYTIDKIADVLESKGIVSKEDFIHTITTRNFESEYAFLRDIPPNDSYKYKLEGYLFPDTYIVRKNVTSEEIIIKMLNRFEEIISRYTAYTSSSNYTIHELLTVASIIEQEAKLSDERSIIAGVIYNRLNANMYLQMCSSVQYSLNKRKVNLNLEDLKKDSPYNTYLYSGLPIGPICNPGEASLKAALLPEAHDYYYFVLENSETGKHYFSRTSDEHNIAKNRYHQMNDINFTE